MSSVTNRLVPSLDGACLVFNIIPADVLIGARFGRDSGRLVDMAVDKRGLRLRLGQA